ncbi:putative nuclear pore complex subunit nup133 [Erysiphe necator]|uniref:Putative nuclear pore complex subunit nup133 n=1 Tax=Uncinula necator TaxID=52586 RepID=A0A0B1PAZ7_UNCNE|nr:putative nuclear pore complex subunit nup133 [Erysiphe necator]
MFSPPTIQNFTAQEHSQRTSRRRQRPLSSENSGSEPKSKRRRSAFALKLSLTPENTSEKHDTDNKNVKVAASQIIKDGPQGRDLAVRSKRIRSGEIDRKGDGSVILSANDLYSVAKLPALPDRLRSEPENRIRQHGAIYSSCGYAFILNYAHAIVWPYSVNSMSPETFVFTFNEPLKKASDPLPIGALVSASASSSIPGLVVIIPTTGKVTYWESVSSAATYDLRLQRNGVEFSIPLLFGETVDQALNAESTGFILTFSSGRIAYMGVRDGQGRPVISVQFLKIGSNSLTNGIIGSIRNVLSSSSIKGNIAAVRAGNSVKIGEREIVMATIKGKFHYWKMHRGGHTSLASEHEAREPILRAIKKTSQEISDTSIESFQIIDFTFIPKLGTTSESAQVIEEDTNLLVLFSIKEKNYSKYYLVHIHLRRDEPEVQNLFLIKSYTTSINHDALSKPRLHLPKPGLVGFVIFDRAVVVISVARLQLQNENEQFIQAFDDVIDFQHDIDVEIVGSGIEESYESSGIDDPKSLYFKPKHPAIVLLVRGSGVVRVSAINTDRLMSQNPQQVNAKTKLEQAVFYGSLDHNPLNFTVRPELKFCNDEFGAAAIELSDEILRSKTTYISTVAASIDQNLQKRSAALHNLAQYIYKNDINLNRITKWNLLFNAEKMKAASLVWKRFDAVMRTRCPGEKRGLLTEVVESIHENFKSAPVSETGEYDRVRHWFIHDIWNMEIAIPWAYQVIKCYWHDGHTDHNFVLQILSEANDLVINALQGAFEFRAKNLDLYGLLSEQIEDGVLVTGYEGLPEFWTSTTFITENTRKHSELAAVLLDAFWGKPSDKIQSPTLLSKIRNEYCNLVDITIRSNTERIRWCSAQETPEFLMEAKEIKCIQSKTQEQHISVLAGTLGLPDEAMNLAEKHQLMVVLASLLKLDLDTCTHLMKHKRVSEEMNDLILRKKQLQLRTENLFLKFGSKWATALFEVYLLDGSAGELLNSMSSQQNYLTRFLRSRPEYRKISWINDVIRERDFDQAAEALLQIGLKREDDLWSKKISLSIGKLSLCASKRQSNFDNSNPQLVPIGNKLSLIKIQEEIYSYISPIISDAIDQKAELDLVLESLENNALEDQPTFQQFLKERLSSLIKHKAMNVMELVDLLTLMDTGSYVEDTTFFSCQQFYLALKALSLEPPRGDENLVQQIIWRRCMLRDDWAEISDTNMKDDEIVSTQVRATILYQTLKLCYKFGLFEKEAILKPVTPQECLEAGTQTLDHRLQMLDVSIREKLMKEMQIESDALKLLIDSSQLNQWHKTLLDLVKLDLEKELEEEVENEKRVQHAAEQLRSIEELLKNSRQCYYA